MTGTATAGEARPSLRAIEVFLRVAELKSFTKAAESLGLSRASATRLVNELEARTGASLLARTTRHVALTPAGAAFREEAARILGELEGLLLQNTPGTPLTGTLRVACSPGLADFYLGERLEAFLALHPRLSVELRISEHVPQLVAARIDLAFEVTGTPEPSDLVIGRCESVLCASPALLEGTGTPEAPEDLASIPLIAQPYPANWIFAKAGETRRITPKARLLLPSARLTLAAALRGRGAALLPDLAVAPCLADGRLARLLPEWRTPASLLVARLAPSPVPDRGAMALIDFVKAGLKGDRAD